MILGFKAVHGRPQGVMAFGVLVITTWTSPKREYVIKKTSAHNRFKIEE
jgi:hypothetical protein